jgi:outer membrane receptor protein involved in Fe transport
MEMGLKRRLLGTSTLAAVALCLAPGMASAAAPAPAVSADAGAEAVQEIVVTAQKRSENINSVGMAITAKTGEQLEQKGVTTVSDLVKVEPSLQYSQSQSGTPVYTLRGVGYFEQSLSAAPTVSLYQDEIAYPFPVMSRGALLDTERVEILKGPQGTLYGQNATGGAVNFIAAKPTKSFSFGLDDSFGRFNDNLVSGFVSGPLTSTLSARLAASVEEGGAWQKSATRDDSLGDKDTQIGRLIVEWRPIDKLTATLNVNGWEDHSETQAGQLEGFRIQAPQNIGVGSLSDPAFYRPAPVGSAAFNAYPALIQNVLTEPIAPHDPRVADWTAGTHPHNNENFYQTGLRLEYALTDGIGVTSLTNYEHFQEHNQIDPAGVSAPAQFTNVRGSVSTFSQELRVHGVFPDAKGNWLIGANYEKDDVVENDFVSSFHSSASYATAALGLPPFLDFGAVDNDRSTSVSVFANADYHILTSVDVHAGVRYTESDQDLAGCSYSTYPSVTIVQNVVGAELASFAGGHSVPGVPGQCVTLGPAPNFSPGESHHTLNQSNVPWRVGVDWTPLAHNLFYFTVSKGFKAGSAPAVGASRDDQLIPVTQEELLAYELGAKSELFDRTLELNVALFHYDYTNKQELGRLLDPIYGALQALFNIPKSTEDGAEVSVVWRPPVVQGLTLNAAATYLDSKVTSDFFDTGPYPLGPSNLINFKGEAFPFTPKWSLQYGARYDWSVGDTYRAFISAQASYQSRSSAAFGAQEAVADNAPSLQINAYSLLDLTAGIGPADGRWRAEIWGRNVTDTYYWHSVNYVSDTVVRLTGEPATYGVRVSYRY